MKPFFDPTVRITPSVVNGRLVYDSFGLIQFRMGFWVEGREVDHLTVVSGQASNQVLQLCSERVAGSGSPIGEGCYTLGDPDATRRINWASGKVGDYGASFKSGLGPVWVGIHIAAGFRSTSYDLGIHPDWNQDDGYPGTNGCLGIPCPARNLVGVQRVVGMFSSYDLAFMVVDLGLGTVPTPPGQVQLPAPPSLYRAKLFARPGAIKAYRNGDLVNALAARLDYHTSQLGVAINGSQIDPSKIESVTLEVAYRAGK